MVLNKHVVDNVNCEEGKEQLLGEVVWAGNYIV